MFSQWGVFPLADNYSVDDYYYLITVHTGLRKAGGTKSKVGFCIAGESGGDWGSGCCQTVSERFVGFSLLIYNTMEHITDRKRWFNESGGRTRLSTINE